MIVRDRDTGLAVRVRSVEVDVADALLAALSLLTLAAIVFVGLSVVAAGTGGTDEGRLHRIVVRQDVRAASDPAERRAA